MIRLLDELTINQIAAGEVIEDSASCVKELVENALDAGATSITIETKKGGQELIVVTDNGSGMSEEELEWATVRHATSKISSSEDLWRLRTLGFRGEALASIASVSKMTIITAPHEQKIAHQIRVEKGVITERRRAARTQGTTVIVHSLFYNVYARAAFQKSQKAQTQKISTVLTNLALFAQGVGFEWICDDKVILSIAAHTTLKERIILLLGEHFANELLPIESISDAYAFSGFIGNLSSHRANRLHQHLSINGRLVLSPRISEAIERAYDRRIPEGRYIPFVATFSMPPETVDVNVHPQKREVRFRDTSAIEGFFIKAVNALFADKERPKLSSSIFSSLPLQKFSLEKAVMLAKDTPSSPSPLATQLHIHLLLGEYVLVELDQFYLIDLPRASQYIVYQTIKRELGKESLFPAQRLLIPQTYTCSLAEAEVIEMHLDVLRSFGFELRPFGNGSFIIETICPHYDIENTLELLHNLYLEKKKIDKEALVQMVCTRASRRSYTLEQARTVARELFALEGPYCLAQGKAVTFALTKDNLQKIFK